MNTQCIETQYYRVQDFNALMYELQEELLISDTRITAPMDNALQMARRSVTEELNTESDTFWVLDALENLLERIYIDLMEHGRIDVFDQAEYAGKIRATCDKI